MNVTRRPGIVVLGNMTMAPVGGVIWQTIHYLVGLQRLGFDVYYLEEHGNYPCMFDSASGESATDGAGRFLAKTLERFDLGSRWSYHAWHDEGQYLGLGEGGRCDALAGASAVINLCGATLPRPEYRADKAFIYLETDPVAPEIELHNGVANTREFLDAHTTHFTFGENLGGADCGVPMPPAEYCFHPTRQPVVMDFWDHENGEGERFTTIANWRQEEREISFRGEAYGWSKHHEFLKFIDLPRRVPQQFELALSSYDDGDREMLESRGWKVTHALHVSLDPDAYRAYIARSRGEWTVAKDQNVRLRSGWFSDRAATYLAAARPVITQETGFSNILPTGNGLFSFSTLEEAVQAVKKINADYAVHCRAARAIAHEFFSHDKVLTKLLRDAGISLPSPRKKWCDEDERAIKSLP